MIFDGLLKRLVDSRDPVSADLVADLTAGRVEPVEPGPGRENASNLSATFAIRLKTSAAAGIKTIGLETAVAQLNALPPGDPILLFHFSGPKRTFSVFVRESDEQVVGMVMVERGAGTDATGDQQS